MSRRSQLPIAWLLGTALSAVSFALSAQDYPLRPIRLVAPSSPGGGTDITARIVAPRLSEYLRQPVVVENRPGAATMIGSEIVARANPDGYTLLLCSTPFATNPATRGTMPYDAIRDFAPVTQIVAMPNMLVSHPSLPVRSVRELIAFAKARPDQITFASAGTGSSPHLSMALFLGMTHLRMIHVPYKGAGQGVVDVIAGHVPLISPSIISVLGYVRAGKLRALGVTSIKRATGAPDIPTIAESGLPGYEATQWFGIVGPAGTPRAIVDRVQTNVVRALHERAVRERLLSSGAEPVGSPPEEFGRYIRTETAKWAMIVKAAGIRAE